ncbi:hypothetical protein DVS77_21600 [Mycolicibacterium moriokaense]|nr:hypothetical protein DVS77_21600 [Mycolicibacterium moriokaense]
MADSKLKHPGGRPLKFKSVAELRKKIDAYFSQCDPHMVEITEWVQARTKDGKLKKDKNGLNYLVQVTHKVMTDQVPYTITGLALALNTSRETLLDYESGNRDKKEDDEGYDPDVAKFSDTIKRAKLRCEQFNEQMLFSSTPTGSIFNLKNNYGWKDKIEQDLTSNGETIAPRIVSPIQPRNARTEAQAEPSNPAD